MRTIVTLLAALLIGGPALAQPAPKVRAIEYPEITRLVLPAGPDVTWTVRQDGTEARLIFAGTSDQFDVSDVPRQIPRTRILSVVSGVTPIGTSLELSLGCSCDINIRRLDSAYLSVDIRRAAMTAMPTEEEPLGAMESAGAGLPASSEPMSGATQPMAVPKDDSGADAGAMLAQDDAAPDAAQVMAPQDTKPMENAVAPAATEPPAPTSQDLLPARDALLGELGLAARDGLIELAPAGEAVPAPQAEPSHAALDPAHDPHLQETQPESVAPAPMADAMPEDQIKLRDPNISVTRKVDEHTAVAGAGPRTCPPGRAVNAAEWAMDEDSFATGLSALRSSLVSTEGTYRPHEIERLARFYILHGFGHEARALLGHPVGQSVPGAQALAEMSMVVDSGRPPEAGVLATADGCGGAVDLWRAAAGLDLPDYGSESGARVLDELSRLPTGLRRLLAQQMAQKAIVFGHSAGARAVFEVLDRTPGPEPAQQAFLRLLIENEGLDVVSDELLEVASLNPHLLELYADAVLASGIRPDPDLANILQDIERIHRSGPAGPRLRSTRTRLIARAGEPARALDLLKQGQVAWPDDRSSLALTARMILSELDVTSVETLRLAVKNADFLEGGADSKALAYSLASALLDAGLPNAAQDMLARVDADIFDRNERILKANIALAAGQDPDVPAILEGVVGEDADRLRSQAFRRQANWTGAYDVTAEAMGAERAYLALLDGRAQGEDARTLVESDNPLAALIDTPSAQDVLAAALDETADTPEAARAAYLAGIGELLGQAERLRRSLE